MAADPANPGVRESPGIAAEEEKAGRPGHSELA
jgi:hypothetical protein